MDFMLSYLWRNSTNNKTFPSKSSKGEDALKKRSEVSLNLGNPYLPLAKIIITPQLI